MGMTTLNELSIGYAQKQANMIDAVTEGSPELSILPLEPASHGVFDVSEEVSEIDSFSSGWIDLNAEVPEGAMGTKLTRVDLGLLARKIYGKEDTVDNFPGGVAAYFRKHSPKHVKAAAQAAGTKILYDTFRAKALADGNSINAGGTGYSIIAVRFEAGTCNGLINGNVQKSGEFFQWKKLNGGNVFEHPSTRENVYGMYFKAYFGVRVPSVANKHIAVIANIDKTHTPSTEQIMELLSMVHADSNTYLMMHRRTRDFLSKDFIFGKIQVANGESGVKLSLEALDGVPIISTWNMLNGTEAAVSFS